MKSKKLQQAYELARAAFSPVIVVLDDDPTGTQTVQDVSVYTEWSAEVLTAAFQNEEKIFFVLTNSRSLTTVETTALHTEIAHNLSAASQKTGRPFLVISRGDSTLRGHFPLETATLQKALVKENQQPFAGEIICPAFFEGGRYTLDDVHYLATERGLIPVNETEFAQDPTFGFQAANLRDYIAEKTAGAYPATACLSISLAEIRQGNLTATTKKIASAAGFNKIIVNAVNYDDLEFVATAFMQAIAQGKNYLVRCAASFPKVLGQIPDRPLLTAAEIVQTPVNGGLIIIGSHVQLSTAQLAALKGSQPQFYYLEFATEQMLHPENIAAYCQKVVTTIAEKIQQGQTVVLYTTRQFFAPQDFSKEEKLQWSVTISQALTSVVAQLPICPKYLIAKGGITSSDVATKGLGIKKALVLGQIRKGIPVWLTGAESKFPQMAYLIFPGNVGTVDTLKEIVEELERR